MKPSSTTSSSTERRAPPALGECELKVPVLLGDDGAADPHRPVALRVPLGRCLHDEQPELVELAESSAPRPARGHRRRSSSARSRSGARSTGRPTTVADAIDLAPALDTTAIDTQRRAPAPIVAAVERRHLGGPSPLDPRRHGGRAQTATMPAAGRRRAGGRRRSGAAPSASAAARRMRARSSGRWRLGVDGGRRCVECPDPVSPPRAGRPRCRGRRATTAPPHRALAPSSPSPTRTRHLEVEAGPERPGCR